MTNTVISQGLARQSERPDIHHKVDRLANVQSGYPPTVAIMVRDLKESVPGLSIRQLSVLVGVSVKTVQNALSDPNSASLSRDPVWGDPFVEVEHWTADDNEASAANELAALREHHPGGYRDEIDFKDADPDEVIDIPVFLSSPPFRDPYRRADQSHTVKRPITLATRPFDVAA